MAQTEEKALYVGEAGNVLSDGTPLIPHVTIALVGHDEAVLSDLWEPVEDGEPDSENPRNSPPDYHPEPDVPETPTGEAA